MLVGAADSNWSTMQVDVMAAQTRSVVSVGSKR
jgi:hypothetical protein